MRHTSCVVRSLLLPTLVLLMLPLFLSVPSATAAESIHLTYSDMFPADHPFGRLAREWGRRVLEETGGRVVVTIYDGGSLTSPQECFAGVLDGRSDICHTGLAYTPHRFPVMEAADFPGYPAEGNTARLTTLVAQGLFQAFKPEEFAGVEVLYLHAHPPGAFTTIERPVHKVADLAGLRIRSTGLSASIASILRGTPVSLPATQTFELLASGAVDATMTTFESLRFLRFGEIAKYTAIAPELGYVTTFAVMINEKVWEGLSSETRAAIARVSEEFGQRAALLWDVISEEGYRHAIAHGHEFIAMDADDVDAAARHVQEVLARSYVRRLADIGLDGKAVLAKRNELIEAHVGVFMPIDLED